MKTCFRQIVTKTRTVVRIFPSAMLLIATGCTGGDNEQLETILHNGTLRFAVLAGPSTYFHDGKSVTGLDYEMATRFVERLGVKLDIIPVSRASDIESLIRRGKVDIGSSGAGLFPEGDNLLTGPSYQQVKWHMIYNRHTPRLQLIDSVMPGQLVLTKDHHFIPQLEKLAYHNPQLKWEEFEGTDTQILFELLNQGKIDLTIADSNTFAFYQQLFPDVRIAFDLGNDQPAAWIYRGSRGDLLDRAIHDFFHDLKQGGELQRIIKRNRSHLINAFDYADSKMFIRNVSSRLPSLRKYFEDAGMDTGLDWRLLAALSYQESHWDPEARSATGVRGLMMLTRTTAKQIGIDNRLEPEQSIDGGANYLRAIMKRLPPRIQDPDRTWLAIAAYNVGLGHLEDARILAQKQGGNPDNWFDVRSYLPLLKEREWFEKTRHGYARGNEPVIFVSKIRKYYDMLRLLFREEPATIEKRGLRITSALLVDSPVL